MVKDRLDESDVASAWNRNADQWADDLQAGLDRYREVYTLPAFLDFMPKIEGLKAIDLGCGEGANTRRFARLGGRVTGIDLSARLIARAVDQERREPLGIQYQVCSYNRMDGFEDRSFDVALSTMAFMDGPDFAATARETYRVLAPGGVLCFSVLHPCFTTPGFAWVRASDGSYSGLMTRRYFERTPFVENWRFAGKAEAASAPLFEVPRFPRTLSDYLSALCDCGFRISGIQEPRPSEATARDHPSLARWREHAPLVLMIAATKT